MIRQTKCLAKLKNISRTLYLHGRCSPASLFRLYYNLTENSDYTITFENIYYRYMEHCGAAGLKVVSKNELGRLIGSVFSNYKKLNVCEKACYRGLGWRSASNLDNTVPRTIIPKELVHNVEALCLSSGISVLVNNANCSVNIDTNKTCNGAPIYKEITFHSDHWELKCRGITMDLHFLGITPKYFLPTSEQAAVILKIVHNIR